MGQKLSSPPIRDSPWILGSNRKKHNPNPEQPIKFQYKTRRKSTTENEPKTISLHNVFPHYRSYKIENRNEKLITSAVNNNNNNNISNVDCNKKDANPLNASIARTKSEPNLNVPNGEKRHSKHRRKVSGKFKNRNFNTVKDNFGYDIQDIDKFLAGATIDKPANIPVVLSQSSVLYQTRIGGYQEEISLPLGMVVNAVFRNQNWLYVQTPHAEEGYINYSSCIALGIIPHEEQEAAPCWETSTDVFPRPSGNLTDTDKMSSARSECSTGRCRRNRRHKKNDCGEKSVDRLYLRSLTNTRTNYPRRALLNRETLLVICNDYEGESENTLSVKKGDVVSLMSAHMKGWFWVRNKEDLQGFIPASVAGHGFL